MSKVTHLMIHCASTPENGNFDHNSILHWHMLPKDNGDGTFKYKSKIYKSVEDLPDEYIGGLSVKKYRGSHGWSAPGYYKIFNYYSTVQIWPNNEDANVDGFELTNGILSSDPLYKTTRHVCYIGGMDKTNKIPKDTRTPSQLKDMETECLEMIQKFPWIKLIGHNQINYRACPSFSVPIWAKSIGIPDENIDQRPLIYKL